MTPRRLALPLALALLAGASGCVVFEFRRPQVHALDPAAPPVEVRSPVKAHLLDGDVVLFRDGVRFAGGGVEGRGERYGADGRARGLALRVPLDSVAAMETFTTEIREPQSVGATIGVSAVTAAASLLLFKAVFGSCPTTYSDSAGTPALEAESFSNSVAPLLEMRDVDRLAARPDAAGRLRLEVRDEALETHYINHIELVEARHRPGETAVPAPLGRAWALRDAAPPARARARSGADAAATLAAQDGAVYRTPDAVLAAATEGDPTDWIELAFPAPAADTAAVLLRLRNSLFSTVYFYEFMLARQGPAALDWVHRGLANVGTAIEMGDYYQRRMGLRVEVWDGAAWAEAGRVVETGPIAWNDVAVAFPTPPGPEVRLRLRFVADAWRIDRAALAAARAVPTRAVPLARVERPDGSADAEALARLSRPDRDYHVTRPGDRFFAAFEPGATPAGEGRTYFLAAQGYYIEWIRGEWLRGRPAPFRADDATLVAALRRWREAQPAYEARFASTRIPPVR